MSLNKIVILLLAAVVLFTSCYAKVVVFQEAPVQESVKEDVKTDTSSKTQDDIKPVMTEGEMKTGLSFSANTTSSKDGNAQTDAVMVAVSVDSDGVIRECIIDSVQAKVAFDSNGMITSDISSAVESKNELGSRYGMAKASSIGKEWNEQMKALSEYVVGKTAEEVKGISIVNGKAGDVDLASSVTLYIGGFLSQIVEAVESAEYRGAQVGDKLSLVSYTDLSSSKSADAEKAGNAQSDISVMVLTLNGDKITSAYTDAIQSKIAFNSLGKLVGTLSEDVASKNELKEKYGMGAYSSIGTDWYKQADSYTKYITGKSVQEALSIAVNEKAAPADADLSSSVTMSIGNFNKLLKKVQVSNDLKIGLSFSANTTSSKDGNAQTDAVMVAVSVDSDGVIRECIIDSVQAKVAFDSNGMITSDISSAVESKNELGSRYGMAKASSIGKEWNEQMKALSEYVVGKTAEEVKGISIVNGKAGDVDLASSVTLYIGGFLSQIVEAVESAEYRGAQVGDKLSLVSYTDLSSSKSADVEKAGNAQSDISVMVLTLNGDKITSAYTDAIQSKIAFNSLGKLVGTLSEDVASKNELKEKYGMGAYSSIGADWYKQADSYTKYITGKSVQEALSIAVNEKAAPADADLSSSVTMSIGNFNKLLKKVQF